MSVKTQALFEKRTRMKKCNQGQYDDLQKAIRESSLQDYTNWVEEHSAKMNKACGQGDTKAIYKSVKELAANKEEETTQKPNDGRAG